jgi:hypothetical protein
MIYKCNYFKIEELVPKNVFNNSEDKNNLWLIFNKDLLKIADYLREDYGKMTCNDWLWGGHNDERGFREWTTTTGAKYSQHKFGRALDLIPSEYDVEKIREDIINRKKPYMKLITCVEMDIWWLHFDLRNSIDNNLIKVYP